MLDALTEPSFRMLCVRIPRWPIPLDHRFAFQKKSKSGIATTKKDIDLIHQRLAAAKRDYEGRQKEHEDQKKNR
jgi:hypothetical protein